MDNFAVNIAKLLSSSSVSKNGLMTLKSGSLSIFEYYVN